MLSRHFGLDPLGTIASGAMLAACAPAVAGRVLRAFDAEGLVCRVIGHIAAASAGVTIADESGSTSALPRFDSDEVTKLTSGA